VRCADLRVCAISGEMSWPECANRIVDERVILHVYEGFTIHQITGFKSGKGTGNMGIHNQVKLYPVYHSCYDDAMPWASEDIA
jgi:hypothetical protein